MIKKFDSSGALLRAWGGPGTTDGKFTGAWAIGVSRASEVHVLDESTLWVQVFDGDGKFLRKWGGADLGGYHPRAMTIDAATDTVFIADTGRKRVLMYGTDGSPKGEIGSAAAGVPEAERPVEPAGVATARDGSIYVADAPARLIRRYTRAGRQQSSWGFAAADAIDGPRLAAAPDGSVYATLPGACAVVQFDVNGTPTRSFGQCGNDDYLGRPGGLTFDAAGKLYVTDVGQGAVRVYAP
jgi:sugar lactone lactonase YvrE